MSRAAIFKAAHLMSTAGFVRLSSSTTAHAAFPRIYTRTGDKGKTSTFTGERRSKDDKIFMALGATDELSSHIGYARELAAEAKHPYTDRLQRIQCILQDVSSHLATPRSSARDAHVQKTTFSSRHSKELEDWMDEYSKQLLPLENFILPGGGKASAFLHVTRTVCRRAERHVVTLSRDSEIQPETLVYLNRLSDFLFIVARLAARLEGKEETIYIRPDKDASQKN